MNVKTATAQTRTAVRKALGLAGVTITSRMTADPVTLDAQVVTVVTYPLGADRDALADLVTPGALTVCSGDVAMTIIRAA